MMKKEIASVTLRLFRKLEELKPIKPIDPRGIHSRGLIDKIEVKIKN